MQSRLQDLTDKIYQEGLNRGNEEAEKIIANAKEEAQKIIENAKKEADGLMKEASKKAEELKTNTDTELKLSAKQMLSSLKQQITSLVNGKIIDVKVNDVLQDKDFVKSIIETIVKNWHSDQSGSELSIILPEKKQKELSQYFESSAKELIDKGVDLQYAGNISAGFHIAPKDGSYKISFSDEEFQNFFKSFLRPKLIELLFSEE